MAVDYLSAINKQGSGLNVTQIVDSLVQAETAPIESRIQRKIEEKERSYICLWYASWRIGKTERLCVFIKRNNSF